MFFKDYFNSIADIIDAKFRSYQNTSKNPADKGELCEIFLKEFLDDSIGDSFKIFRGGRIVNSVGDESKQIDIVLAGKRSIKLFGDKGIYPIETIFGCCSITATLDKKKLIDCCSEFMTIPKNGFKFDFHGYLKQSFVEQTMNAWKYLIPYKIIFAYKGSLKAEWIEDMQQLTSKSGIAHNALPDLVVVNKVGMIEKSINKKLETEIVFTPFDQYPNYGIPFGKMLYHLNNLNWEELFLRPDLSIYLNKDLYP